ADFDVEALTTAIGAAVSRQSGWRTAAIAVLARFDPAAEAIRRDLLLFGSGGAPFADAPDRNRMLAERLAGLTAEENTKWVEYSRQAGDKQDGQSFSTSQSSSTAETTTTSADATTFQATATTQAPADTGGEGV
ncbi:MAG TPA: hypothetical protein VFS20_01305, partial [Longimicrobium sp.]|nr:hypothetical protein [Longimicrobium sp.]